MMRTLFAISVLVVASSLASAQSTTSWRGLVHREITWGCGQMWSLHVARSDVTVPLPAEFGGA